MLGSTASWVITEHSKCQQISKKKEETRRAAGKTCIRKSTLVEIVEDEFKCCTIVMGK